MFVLYWYIFRNWLVSTTMHARAVLWCTAKIRYLCWNFTDRKHQEPELLLQGSRSFRTCYHSWNRKTYLKLWGEIESKEQCWFKSGAGFIPAYFLLSEFFTISLLPFNNLFSHQTKNLGWKNSSLFHTLFCKCCWSYQQVVHSYVSLFKTRSDNCTRIFQL